MNSRPGLRAIDVLLLIGLFAYPWLLKVFQGIDMTDAGFYAANARFTLSAPESVMYGFSTWLSNLIPGLWLALFPASGYLGLQLLGVLIQYGIMGCVYALLRPWYPPRHLLGGLLLTQVFVYYYNLPANYNHLTVLFFVLAALCLHRGYLRQSPGLMALTGLLVALNVFVRLPNALGVGLILGIWIVGRREGRSSDELAGLTLYYLLGGMLGTGLLLGLMGWLGHLEVFRDMLRLMSRLASESGSSFSLRKLAVSFIWQHQAVIVATVLFAALMTLMGRLLTRLGQTWQRAGLWLALAAWVLLLAVQNPGGTHFNLLMVLAGLVYLLAAWTLWQAPSPAGRLLGFLAGVILVLVPFGSGNGILNSVFGLWLGLPWALAEAARLGSLQLSLAWQHRDAGDQAAALQLPAWVTSQLLAGSAALCLLVGLVHSWHYTYRDAPNRLSLSEPIRHPLLWGMRTTPARARMLEATLNELARHVRPGDLLLAYAQMPLIHFLTGTRPYLGNSWPGLYEPAVLEDRLQQAPRMYPSLPAALLDTCDMASATWPESVSRRPRSIFISDFFALHAYRKVWQNDCFELWLPPTQKPSSAPPQVSNLLISPRSSSTE